MIQSLSTTAALNSLSVSLMLTVAILLLNCRPGTSVDKVTVKFSTSSSNSGSSAICIRITWELSPGPKIRRSLLPLTPMKSAPSGAKRNNSVYADHELYYDTLFAVPLEGVRTITSTCRPSCPDTRFTVRLTELSVPSMTAYLSGTKLITATGVNTVPVSVEIYYTIYLQLTVVIQNGDIGNRWLQQNTVTVFHIY